MNETTDYVALRRLQNRYADACSRRDWDDLEPLFTADATVTLDLVDRELVFRGATEVGEFIGAQLEQFSFFQFVIRNTVIDLATGGDDDAAAGRIWMSEFRCHVDTEEWSTIFGLYQDRYRRTAGGWRIASRRYNSLARPAVGQVFDPPDLVAFPPL